VVIAIVAIPACPCVIYQTHRKTLDRAVSAHTRNAVFHRAAFKFGYDLAVPKPLDESVLRTRGVEIALLKVISMPILSRAVRARQWASLKAKPSNSSSSSDGLVPKKMQKGEKRA
jgi:hypothetical protein